MVVDTSGQDWRHRLGPPSGFEHGTVAFLDILALRHGKELITISAPISLSNPRALAPLYALCMLWNE